jgi:hypothetical protein
LGAARNLFRRTPDVAASESRTGAGTSTREAFGGSAAWRPAGRVRQPVLETLLMHSGFADDLRRIEAPRLLVAKKPQNGRCARPDRGRSDLPRLHKAHLSRQGKRSKSADSNGRGESPAEVNRPTGTTAYLWIGGTPAPCDALKKINESPQKKTLVRLFECGWIILVLLVHGWIRGTNSARRRRRFG